MGSPHPSSSSRLIGHNIEEIERDPVLRVYGAILAGTHLLSLAWWLYDGQDVLFMRGHEHICWPFFEGCSRLPYPSPDGVHALLTVYGVIAGGTALLLVLRRELTALGYWGLVALTLAKALLMALDFRTRLNQHHMILAVTVPFLFLPNKRTAIRLLLPFFYAWAGSLKLNREWLSGAALYGRTWPFDAQTLPWACGYVVVLELVFVWGLWARSKWIFWGTLCQLILFHAYSWGVVNFFYPLLMLGLLAVFPLCRASGNEDGAVLRAGPTGAGWAYVAAFSLLQMVPYAFPGDTVLTGEGRLFALHMFDAQVQCHSRALIHHADGSSREVDLFLPLVPRIRCDPVVYVSRLRTLCASLAGSPDVTDVDWALESKRTSDGSFTSVVNAKGVCRNPLSYSVWHHNPWIALGDR